MINALVSVWDTLFIWLSIVLIAAGIAITITLIVKFVPAFKNRGEKKTKEENAKESVESLLKDDTDIIEERKLLIERNMKRIETKAEERDVTLNDDDFLFLLMQEDANEIDNNFFKRTK